MIGVPFHSDPWNEIVPGLFVGGHDRANGNGGRSPVIVGDEFDLVVSLYRRDGYGPAEGVRHLRREVPDGRLHADEQRALDDVVDEVVRALDAGQAVLVRCQAGYNRSALVAALALLRRGYGADEAIARVRERRSPWALFNEHFVRYVRETETGR